MSKSTTGASAPASKSINGLTPLRCRKGDLAILLTGSYAGIIVDVLEYHSSVTVSNAPPMVDAWHIRHPSDEPRTKYYFEDRYMLPIRPGDLDQTETDELSLVSGRSA